MNIFSEIALLLLGADRENKLSHRTMNDVGCVNLKAPKPITVVRHGREVTYDVNNEYCDGDGRVWNLNTDAVYERYRDNPSGGNDNPNSAPWGWVGEGKGGRK